ncbi:biotin/lipoyl-containing protein [uncultured Roseibium sp.]|uniref:acetyl-CoA carboxylase biotin carboxyl carrier protein n=1 Tax=uncultured Roseibium sp. TaxID=1936171 RepID=UPI003216FDEB
MQQLTYQDVLTILRLIDSGPFSRFEVEFEGTKLAVSRAASPSGAAPAEAPGALSAKTESAAPASAEAKQAVETTSPSAGQTSAAQAGDFPDSWAVRSPMAGTFYAAPSPGAPPFVDVGTTVGKADQLGSVEVMKLFTAIRAPFAGTVRAIAVANEELVEKDGLIMWIEPADESNGNK